MNNFNLDKYIDSIQDFPQKGILFRDISPLLENNEAMTAVINIFEEKAKLTNVDLIAGIESRGFLFSTLLANKLKIGSFMIRKPKKLPGEVYEKSYSLEYGDSSLSIQKSRDINNKNIIIVDDLIATGGSLACSESLIKRAKGNVIKSFVLIELTKLNGRKFIEKDLFSIKKY